MFWDPSWLLRFLCLMACIWLISELLVQTRLPFCSVDIRFSTMDNSWSYSREFQRDPLRLSFGKSNHAFELYRHISPVSSHFLSRQWTGMIRTSNEGSNPQQSQSPTTHTLAPCVCAIAIYTPSRSTMLTHGGLPAHMIVNPELHFRPIPAGPSEPMQCSCQCDSIQAISPPVETIQNPDPKRNNESMLRSPNHIMKSSQHPVSWRKMAGLSTIQPLLMKMVLLPTMFLQARDIQVHQHH